ncbi:RNA-directed DNA polymerase [Photobacterium kishitanii]|uniref:RNA-directed DNA polymerase n=1 Tax=Photobacterium kishitanii TaxID=318456 RepID=UPI000A99E0F4|nr:RNA-directed DNA polymerase [Photobacterium kishitanii]
MVKDITHKDPDSCIKHVLDRFENWSWSKESKILYDEVCINEDITSLENKKGIPQGLVAGGFLANIYMLDFDDVVSSYIGKPLFEGDVFLIDACRYVDDLRLIVKVNKFKYTEQEIAEKVLFTFSKYTKDLKLNIQKTKTKVKIFSSKEGAVSSKLADIQSKVSGPMPLHELDEQLGHLEGLIELSDNLNISNNEYNNVGINFVSQLAFIDTTFNDVRKDTILRFTANKIHNLLKQKRNMIAQDVNYRGEPIAGNWDYLQERIARKLISKWTKDPSLTLLLKKGLELFPHIDLLRPVIQNLEEVRQRDNKELVLLAEYCLSEILRHSATVIHIKDKWSFPAHSDYQGYFTFLENYASSKLNDISDLHDALREQILFFCLIRNDSALKNEMSDKTFNIITQIINGFRSIDIDVDETELTTAILLAYQIASDKNKVIRSIESTLEIINSKIFCFDFLPIGGIIFSNPPEEIKNKTLTRCDLQSICRSIMLGDPKLFEIIYKSSRKQGLTWYKEVKNMSNYLGLTNNAKVRGKLSNYNNKKISLLAILRVDDNPFRHENGILMILHSILKQFEKSEIPNPIDISNCTVECSDWDSILQLNHSTKLDIDINYLSIEDKFFHSPPKWLIEEHYSLYYLGMFIRNCLLGLVDWSGSLTVDQGKPAYRGIKSNLLKRQIGIAHSPEIFGDSKSPMSNWLSSLLFKLLQWPGVDNVSDDYDWPKNWNLIELNKLIEKRIEIQGKGFCRLTNIPTYVEKVNLKWSKDKKKFECNDGATTIAYGGGFFSLWIKT